MKESHEGFPCPNITKPITSLQPQFLNMRKPETFRFTFIDELPVLSAKQFWIKVNSNLNGRWGCTFVEKFLPVVHVVADGVKLLRQIHQVLLIITIVLPLTRHFQHSSLITINQGVKVFPPPSFFGTIKTSVQSRIE